MESAQWAVDDDDDDETAKSFVLRRVVFLLHSCINKTASLVHRIAASGFVRSLAPSLALAFLLELGQHSTAQTHTLTQDPPYRRLS